MKKFQIQKSQQILFYLIIEELWTLENRNINHVEDLEC